MLPLQAVFARKRSVCLIAHHNAFAVWLRVIAWLLRRPLGERRCILTDEHVLHACQALHAGRIREIARTGTVVGSYEGTAPRARIIGFFPACACPSQEQAAVTPSVVSDTERWCDGYGGFMMSWVVARSG